MQGTLIVVRMALGEQASLDKAHSTGKSSPKRERLLRYLCKAFEMALELDRRVGSR